MKAAGLRAGLAILGTVALVVPAAAYGSGSVIAGVTSLEEQVRRQLASLPYYSVFDNLLFQVQGGEVILSGQVTQPVVKEDAERAVRNLPGVRSVNSQIEVLPLSRNDDQIRRSIYYAVYEYGPLQRYGSGTQPAIRIVVKNGHVTLAGVVANAVDRSIVLQRAKAVPGVFSVTNNLLIEV